MGASKRGILVKLHGRESVRRDCGGLDQRSKERQPRCRVEADHQRPQSACDVPSGVGQSADSGNDKRGLWEDDLALALLNMPWNTLARFYRLFALLPWSARHAIFNGLLRLEKRRFGVSAQHWIILRSYVRRMIESLLRRPRQGYRA